MRGVFRSGKHSSTVGSLSIKILEEMYSNFRSYDFLKTFSYNGPYGRKFIFKNEFPPNANFYFLQTLSIEISLMADNSGKISIGFRTFT